MRTLLNCRLWRFIAIPHWQWHERCTMVPQDMPRRGHVDPACLCVLASLKGTFVRRAVKRNCSHSSMLVSLCLPIAICPLMAAQVAIKTGIVSSVVYTHTQSVTFLNALALKHPTCMCVYMYIKHGGEWGVVSHNFCPGLMLETLNFSAPKSEKAFRVAWSIRH